MVFGPSDRHQATSPSLANNPWVNINLVMRQDYCNNDDDQLRWDRCGMQSLCSVANLASSLHRVQARKSFGLAASTPVSLTPNAS
eukprot:813520-Amphidinium_carterae.1